MPSPFTVSTVTPAVGASVTNQAIVQSFTLSPGLNVTSLPIEFAASHTAGDPGAAAFAFTKADDAAGNTTYTFQPITWPMAGHVEFNVAANLEYQPAAGTTCYRIPNPVFSYDVTAP